MFKRIPNAEPLEEQWNNIQQFFTNHKIIISHVPRCFRPKNRVRVGKKPPR
jgi:hypothetical protein